MSAVELVVGLAILTGMVGVLVPILPGSLLVLAAIGVWAIDVSSSLGWATFGIALVVIGAAQVIKYILPGRRLQAAGIPNRTLWAGTVLGVAGFFVVPVVGLFVGFVLGVYVAERIRLGAAEAWPATKHALGAVGLSIIIELTGCLLAAGAWLAAVVAT